MDAWIEGSKEDEKSKMKDEKSKEYNDVNEVQESKKESPVTTEIAENTENKEAVKRSGAKSTAKTKRMDTKPAVESPNREKVGKTAKGV